jgi:methylated-DNA-[protein]-cysteine S-methyltransferase
MTDLFTTVAAAEPAELARLHDHLVAAAAREALLDVVYRTVDSPLGLLLVAATLDGVVRVAFEGEDHGAVLETLASSLSPRILHVPARLDAVARQLADYFAGRRRAFDVAVDLRLVAGFRRGVLDHLRDIPFGATESYADVARAAGSPKAVRAVGSACASNPVPVIVPCHRVVRSDGSIGQYRGGVDAKRVLLTLEAA